MQISKAALIKLFLFLLATSPSLVSAAAIPQPANPPACKDISWDEHDNGLQTRICTEPLPSMTANGAQSRIAKRTEDNVVDEFNTIFSSLMINTTETDICIPPNTTSDEVQRQESSNASYITNSTTSLQRRNTCSANPLPIRSNLSDLPEISSQSWCYRPGPTPNQHDITSLCRNIAQLQYFGARESTTLPFHDDYIVQRAKTSSSSTTSVGEIVGMTRDNTTVQAELGASGSSCVCVTGRERSAGFKVCNCDHCDALIINRGLADMCKTLQSQCTSKGFSSGHIKSSLSSDSNSSNSSLPNAIISLFTYPTRNGPKSEPAPALDPILEMEGAVKSTCRSGDADRQGQDYSGPVIECREVEVGRFKGGRWCRDVVKGGEKVWVKEKEDPMEKLRGVRKGEGAQFGDE